MFTMKSTLIAAAVSFAFAGAASAQSMTDFGDGVAMVVTSSGMAYLGGKPAKVNATGHAMMMKHGTPIKAGTIIYRSGNNYYLLENKMIDGKMTEDHARGWF